jgi:hypothetical protein
LESRGSRDSKPWKVFFPARQWELERCPRSATCALQADAAASAQAYALLAYTNAAVEIPTERFVFRPTLRWLIRARGQGTVQCEQRVDGQPYTTNNLTIHATNWTWYAVSVSAYTNFAQVGLALRHAAGALDLDYALLLDGSWSAPAKGQPLELPGALFFHAGMTDRAQNAATFRVGHDGAGISLYGPKLPLDAGVYQIEAHYDSPAKSGTVLGAFNLDQGATTLTTASLIAGQPLRLRVTIPQNLPINLVFVYAGAADVTLRQIVITRLE